MAGTFSSIITTEEFNAYIQESVTPDDDKFLDFKQNLITGCVKAIEHYTGLIMAAANYTEIFNGDGSNKIFLRNLPVNSVASVKQDGVALAATEWYASSELGIVSLRSALTGGFQNYSVTYNAGFGLTLVPDDIKLACKIWTAFNYQKAVNKRHGVTSVSMGNQNVSFFERGMPEDAAALLNNYRQPLRSFST